MYFSSARSERAHEVSENLQQMKLSLTRNLEIDINMKTYKRDHRFMRAQLQAQSQHNLSGTPSPVTRITRPSRIRPASLGSLLKSNDPSTIDCGVSGSGKPPPPRRVMSQPRASINSGSMGLIADSPCPSPCPTPTDDAIKKVIGTSAFAPTRNSKRFSNGIIDGIALKRVRSQRAKTKLKSQKSQKVTKISKLETKVRHELDTLLRHVEQSAADFHFDDEMSPKSGDIHGLLETMLSRLTQITEEFARRQTQCKEQSTKWRQLRSEWSRFEQRFDIREPEHSCHHDHIGSEHDSSTFDVQQRFQALSSRMAELEQNNREMQLMRNMEFEQFRGEYLAKEKENNGLQLEVERLQDEHHQFLALRREFSVEYKAKLKAESENKDLTQQIAAFKFVDDDENHEMKRPELIDYGTQTEGSSIGVNARLSALQADNTYLTKELDGYIADRSRFKECTERHQGDIQAMAVSPIAHQVATSGANDNSVLLWMRDREKEFVPRLRALVDGKVLSISFCAHGELMAAGCSLKHTPNGYVVVWDLSNDAKVFCNLRSMTTARFGRVRCIEFLKQKGSHLLFGGDTTGCILCWNLSSRDRRTPVCVISGHSDIIYDLHIAHRQWLFSVSHDEQLRVTDIAAFLSIDADAEPRSVEYIFSKKLFSDDSKYPLKSIAYNAATEELVFGSRKCCTFKVGTAADEQKEEMISKLPLNTKDLDHIQRIEIGANLLMLQRRGVHYVKLFSLESSRVVKKLQTDKKTRVCDCSFSHDRKYAILAVAGLHSNSVPCAIKAFKIPKKSKTAK